MLAGKEAAEVHRMVTCFSAWLLEVLGKQSPATEQGAKTLNRLSQVRALIICWLVLVYTYLQAQDTANSAAS